MRSGGQRRAPQDREGAGTPGAPSRLAIWGALVAVYLLWGSTYLGIRIAIQTIPPFLMAAARYLSAGGMLYAVQRLRGDARPSLREWRGAGLAGLLLLTGGNGCVVWVEQRVASGPTALLVGTVPLWMVLLEALRPGGQRPGAPAVAGTLLGFGGVVLLAESISRSGGFDASLLVALLSAVLWAVGSVVSRKVPLPASPLLGTAMEMLGGGAGLLVLAALAGEIGGFDWAAVSRSSLVGFAYLVVFGAWVGFGAYTWLLRVAPLPLVSTYAYVNPVVAVFLGHILAGESLTPRTLLATGIIAGSVALTTWPKKQA